MASVGVIIMVGQNQEVRRMSNATIVARKGTSEKSVGVTRREEKAKNT